jgi:DNA-binding beta-propeller fold protein YncE
MRALPRSWLLVLGGLSVTACAKTPPSLAASDPSSPLRLERRIPLPNVKGRIDHLAIDEAGQRLFVAEVDNGTVDEIDLATGKLLGRIGGLREPQGVGYLSAQRELVVASGDGTVRFFASDRRPLARIDLGDDADDVRIDPRNGHVLVGYGSGGIATIDPATHRLLTRLSLGGHPEGFQLIGSRIFVNIADRGSILAADLDRGKVQATWPTGLHRLNFPMAVATGSDRILVAYRLPATLASIRVANGTVTFLRPSCGDSDDLYVDKSRVFVICGAGHVNVQQQESGETIVRVATAPGARTGILSGQRGKLYVAAPARDGPAAIWELAITPE